MTEIKKRKQYVLGMLFYRYISENLTVYLNKRMADAGFDGFDYANMPDEKAETARREMVSTKGFFILPSELFANVCRNAAQDDNLNATLEKTFKHIEESASGSESEDNFKGLFDDMDVNSKKLGDTVAKRNEKLVKLLQGVQGMNLGSNYQDNTIDAFGDAYEFLMGMYASNAGKSDGEYYTPQEVSELLARITTVGKTTVNKVYEGTPSESAGLIKDDVIVSVDGTEAASMELSELVKLIRGEKGTTVHLEIYRPSTEGNLSFDVERQDITLPSVSHKMFEDGIGYVHIDSFETETAAQFEEAVKDLENQGMKALIIDVRYNPGGMVTAVVQILDDILPEGTVVYTEDKNGNRQDYTSSGDTYLDYPLAVLINGESASASEILAGAVKDYQYGTLIGTTTFGKGIVQTIFPLEDGDAVKLTTAKYFTPNGNYIHGVGIGPDIELEYEYLDKDATSYDEAYDNQIQKAIEVLKDKIQ